MLKTYPRKVLSIFFILGFVFIPLTFNGLNRQCQLTRFIFSKPVAFIQNHFFTDALKNLDFSSDTIGLNLLVLFLFIIALLVIGLLELLKINSSKLLTLFQTISAYYIAFILLKYGFDKVFKQQFYLPEPNILYTNFGSLNKDILYWSTIGISHFYSVITGAIEVLTAILILINRTRVFGFFIALGVLLNILLINFSFDISVKTFTLFLLAVVLFNLYPYLKTIYAFFIQRKQVQLVKSQSLTRLQKCTSIALSITIICFLLYPYIASRSFNGDNAERPLLHGAYQIEYFTVAGDTLSKPNFPYKRLFIHRNSYIIFQQQNDQMVDYHIETNPVNKQLKLQDYQNHQIILTYTFNEKSGALSLQFNNAAKWHIEAKPLNWNMMPALQDDFHWTIDGIK